MSEPRWRFYIEPRANDGVSNSVCAVKIFKEEGCGLYFQLDGMGVSPPFYFGKTIPQYKGSKGCFRTNDIPTAMRAISVVRDEFVMRRMESFGFNAVDDHQGNQTFCGAVQNDDGSIIVVSTHRNYYRELVQTIWAIDPSRVMCRGKFIYEDDGQFFAFPEGTETIPRNKVEGIVRDALRGFYDGKVAQMMDADPGSIFDQWGVRNVEEEQAVAGAQEAEP